LTDHYQNYFEFYLHLLMIFWRILSFDDPIIFKECYAVSLVTLL